MATNVDEPTNQAYQDAKDQEADMAGTVEEPVEAGEEEIEFELWVINEKKFKKELDNQK